MAAVSQPAMDLMADVLEDPNPIHLDAAATRALGLGDRTINQGPANFGYVMNMLMAAVPGGEIRDLRVRLLSNVRAGDRVTAAGRVESIDEGGGRRRLGCAVWLDIEGGQRAIEGTATVELPD